MGAAAYNRGNRRIAAAADEDMVVAARRAERDAIKAENASLREAVARLERELARARRCLAVARQSHADRMLEARAAADLSDAVIKKLCRLAFPGDSP